MLEKKVNKKFFNFTESKLIKNKRIIKLKKNLFNVKYNILKFILKSSFKNTLNKYILKNHIIKVKNHEFLLTKIKKLNTKLKKKIKTIFQLEKKNKILIKAVDYKEKKYNRYYHKNSLIKTKTVNRYIWKKVLSYKKNIFNHKLNFFNSLKYLKDYKLKVFLSIFSKKKIKLFKHKSTLFKKLKQARWKKYFYFFNKSQNNKTIVTNKLRRGINLENKSNEFFKLNNIKIFQKSTLYFLFNIKNTYINNIVLKLINLGKKKLFNIKDMFFKKLKSKLKNTKSGLFLLLFRIIKNITSAYNNVYEYSKNFSLLKVYKSVKNLTTSLSGSFGLFSKFNNYQIKKKRYLNNIHNYLFINKHSIKHHLISFFLNSKVLYKKTKEYNFFRKKKKKTFFANMWKNKLSTWKKARHYHWNFYKSGTINTRRYKLFLPPFLKRSKTITDLIVNVFTYKFSLSHLFWKGFTELYYTFYNKKIKEKEIYQIPINFLFWRFLKKSKKRKTAIRFKVKSWLLTKIEIRKRFWMEFKRKIPKFFTKQIYLVTDMSNKIQYDFISSYFCLLKNEKVYTTINKIIHFNKLLKLHDFRYKS